MEEDVERKKKWVEDEVFVVLGKRVNLAIYVRSQEEKEGAPSSSNAEKAMRGYGKASK